MKRQFPMRWAVAPMKAALEAGGDRLSVAISAAKAAGRLLLQRQDGITYREKGARDLVTEADLAAQSLVFQQVSQHFPADGQLGEEDSGGRCSVSTLGGDLWVVDPLDGTTNFVHSMPFFCVSIAWLQDSTPQLGVIYDPHREELFVAVRGHGAFLNGHRLRVSACDRMERALVAVSFSARVAVESPEVRAFLGLLPRAQAIRRIGSAALNLAYLAAGRFDAYWAGNGKIWDVAAGVLLVSEAGGVVTGIDGAPFRCEAPHCAAAANPVLHGQLLAATEE